MKKFRFKIISLLCMVFALLMTCSVKINAEDRTGSITVVNKALSGEVLPNINVSLYKVADFTNGIDSGVVLTDDFKDFDINLSSVDSSAEAEKSAMDCLAYINEKNLSSMQTLISDDSGIVEFKDLEKGVYLITQTGDESAPYEFSSSPFFVQLPKTDENGNILFEITTSPKNGVTYPQETYEVSVVKLWKDNNNRDNTRPESIEVGLYGNEELIETVTLSDINNWSYIWSDLSKDIVWDVKEMVIPDNYRMSVENNQNQFTITNQLVIHRESITHGAIETVKGDKTSIKSVATGDTTVLGFYIALFALSGLCILIYVKRCKEQN